MHTYKRIPNRVAIAVFGIAIALTTPRAFAYGPGIGAAILGGVKVRSAADPVARSTVLVDTGLGEPCSGTLIAPDTVLTAAHCLTDIESVRHPEIGFGLSKNGKSTQWREVSSYVNHPDYKKGNGPNDVALVRFKGTVPKNYSPMKSIAMSPDNYAKKSDVLIAGYGQENENAEGDTGEGHLRKTVLKLSRDFQAQNGDLYGMAAHVAGACYGDSGGPAFDLKNGEPRLIGVLASTYIACGGTVSVARTDYNAGFIQLGMKLLREDPKNAAKKLSAWAVIQAADRHKAYLERMEGYAHARAAYEASLAAQAGGMPSQVATEQKEAKNLSAADSTVPDSPETNPAVAAAKD